MQFATATRFLKVSRVWTVNISASCTSIKPLSSFLLTTLRNLHRGDFKQTAHEKVRRRCQTPDCLLPLSTPKAKIDIFLFIFLLQSETSRSDLEALNPNPTPAAPALSEAIRGGQQDPGQEGEACLIDEFGHPVTSSRGWTLASAALLSLSVYSVKIVA